jgi:hypothetical protein
MQCCVRWMELCVFEGSVVLGGWNSPSLKNTF